ncbi:MAG: DUF423 domain-containing protein [Planctomycetota bacterium]
MNHWIAAAGIYGALGIAIGAFGAHGLPDGLAKLGYGESEVERRLDTFETGARYHLYAALALLGVGVAGRTAPAGAWGGAAWLLLTGSCLFSGLLYALAFVGPGMRWLGAIVPIGGVLQIAGWVMIAVAATAAGHHRQDNA